MARVKKRHHHPSRHDGYGNAPWAVGRNNCLAVEQVGSSFECVEHNDTLTGNTEVHDGALPGLSALSVQFRGGGGAPYFSFRAVKVSHLSPNISLTLPISGIPLGPGGSFLHDPCGLTRRLYAIPVTMRMRLSAANPG